jgi:hypothetical protein
MLKIGWASRDVSTDKPVCLEGQAYERISKGILDPTTVTVLAMATETDSVIFISGDFTGFSDGILLEIKDAVAKANPAIDTSKIILSATHTHTAPRYHRHTSYDKAPRDRVEIYPPEKYRAFLIENLVSAICEAWEKKSEGQIAYGLSSAEVAVSRRCVYANDKSVGNKSTNTFAVNGHGIMYGKTSFDDFLGYEGATDANVYFLFTFDLEGALTGAIVNVPCPSQCTESERVSSADYWHETRELIRKKYGNIYILPQCAAAGDLSPHLLHGRAALKRRDRIKYGCAEIAETYARPVEYYNRKVLAERIAHAFDDCFDWAKKETFSDLPITHETVTVPLDAWKLTEEEYAWAKESYEALKDSEFQVTDDPVADFEENTKISSNIARCEKVMERYEKNVDYYDTEIHVLRLGDIAFATCPFELYINYQHRIQGRSPFTQTFFVQLTASTSPSGGYLATEIARANKGYSAISFSCNVSPKGGDQLVEEIMTRLNKLYEA